MEDLSDIDDATLLIVWKKYRFELNPWTEKPNEWTPPPGTLKLMAERHKDSMLETWVEPVPKLGTPARKEWEERQNKIAANTND